MSHFEELEALDPRVSGFAGGRIESPTPHKVAVLMLVKQYLEAKKVSLEAGDVYPPQARRHFCMLLLKLIQYPDMSYIELHNLLTSQRYKIEPPHLEGFEASMEDLSALGIDPLFDFAKMDNIERMLAERTGVSQFSIVGLYIRRVGVVLERLSFPEMMSLYKNIRLYYEKGVRYMGIAPRRLILSSLYQSENAEASGTDGRGDTDETMEESVMDTETVHQERNPYSKWSAKQAELFVTQQSILLENNERRALPPIELQHKLNEIIQDNPLKAQTYFLSYMNQLRMCDYFGAMHALHRAFDRSPIQMKSQYQEKGFQYFSMNLAVMQSNFNHTQEALGTLKESVTMAQECGDKHCLDLANSWYCLLNSNRIDPFEKSLPDLSDPSLMQSLTLAIQFVVKFGAQCGYMPLDLFELLLKCDELLGKNSEPENISDSLALRSALWCLYGRNELSSVNAQLLLHLKKTWIFGDVGNSESVCKVLANLSIWLFIQGEQQLSAIMVQHARERFPRYPNAKNWMVSHCIITIQQSIYRCRWLEAHRACSELYLLDKHAGMLQRAAVFVAKRCVDIAHSILNALLSAKKLELTTHVRALLLLAYSNMASMDSVRIAESVDLLMRASVMSYRAYLDYEYSTVCLCMAQVLLRMGMPHKALQACTNCMDKIHMNGGLYDRAKMDFTFVRCLVETGVTTAQQQAHLLHSLETLDRAVALFKKVEAHAKVLDVYVYIAKKFDALNDTEQRNNYAHRFKNYYADFPVAREYLGMAY